MSHNPPLHVVILAAGKGTRMYSSLPKVLHLLAGQPILGWVIQTAQQLNPAAIHIIAGHGKDQLKQAFPDKQLHWIDQDIQLGTGHALTQALPFLPSHSQTLVLAGDVPLIQPQTLQQLLANNSASHPALNLLLTTLTDPTGYGRIMRQENGEITGIVEQKDASNTQLLINEIYTGICLVNTEFLKHWLPKLQPNNAQEEYYLTDIVKLAIQDRLPIRSHTVTNHMEVAGVNTHLQLAMLERYYQKLLATQLLEKGVRIIDPARIDIRGSLSVEEDVIIDINAIFEGRVVLKKGCVIGPNCVIKDTTIGEHTQILANSVLDGTEVGANCTIGPFARLRPGTHLQENCKIGNFVETKNAQLGSHSKANHLSYLGDVTIGHKVNIGAGTITCNYDGANKHHTNIEDDVFIGSGTQLIAPVHIGKNATIGAGTTLREDAPENALTLTLQKKKTIVGWQRPWKKV